MNTMAGPETKKAESIQRFSLNMRLQHMVLFTSTLTLIVTGVPLWLLGEPQWVGIQDWFASLCGGIDGVRFVHRVAGVVLIIVSAYHIYYTFFTREGRREFINFFPVPSDVINVTLNSMYFLGLRKERPRYGRYTYYEKFDYWAVYWGCVIMIGTGLALWFNEVTVAYLPWFTYDLAKLIHADEAILATLALLIWHFYNVHFVPHRFPGTMLWWHGKMSREEMEEDHPLEYEDLEADKQD